MKTGRTAPPGAPGDPMDAVIRRFRAAWLSEEDVAGLGALREACATVEEYPAGAELVAEGRRTRPMIVLEGWVARIWHLPDGRRQILNFFLPGDVVGFSFAPARVEMTMISAVTMVRIASCVSLEAGLRSDPALGGLRAAIHAAARLLEDLLVDQVVRLGRRTAYERMCHLLLELHDRLVTIGRVHDGIFPMPLTQEVLADAMGLSIVHVNRTLQQLRRDGLLELRSGEARLIEPELMATIADFRPAPARR